MLIDIYKINTLTALFIPAGRDPEGIQLPDDVEIVVTPYKVKIDIRCGSPLVGADPCQIIDDIQRQGYSIQKADIETKVIL